MTIQPVDSERPPFAIRSNKPLPVERFLPWFYGYTEHIYGTAPTLEQWNRICEMIDRMANTVPTDDAKSAQGIAPVAA